MTRLIDLPASYFQIKISSGSDSTQESLILQGTYPFNQEPSNLISFYRAKQTKDDCSSVFLSFKFKTSR
jgi:hypothetical protein